MSNYRLAKCCQLCFYSVIGKFREKPGFCFCTINDGSTQAYGTCDHWKNYKDGKTLDLHEPVDIGQLMAEILCRDDIADESVAYARFRACWNEIPKEHRDKIHDGLVEFLK